MRRPLVIQIWEDDDGNERIRIKSGNGKILLSSEAYEGGKAKRAVDVITDALRRAGGYRVERAND